MLVKLGAVIPVKSYGNVQPSFEVEADSIEAGMAILEPQLRSVWERFVDDGTPLKGGTQGILVEGFCGGSIFYDDINHIYTNDKGEVYESSSQYAAKSAKPFNKQAIANATAKKYGVSAADVIQMWELKGKISRDLGTALHEAIELKRRFSGLSKTLGNTTNVHLSPMVKEAVESLETILPIGNEAIEAVVIDHPNKHVGRVDLINILGDKKVEIVDFKTGEIKPDKLEQYWRQLGFTKAILEANDYEVTKLRLFHWTDHWDVKEK